MAATYRQKNTRDQLYHFGISHLVHRVISWRPPSSRHHSVKKSIHLFFFVFFLILLDCFTDSSIVSRSIYKSLQKRKEEMDRSHHVGEEGKEQLTHLPTCCGDLNWIIGRYGVSRVVHQKPQQKISEVVFFFSLKKKKKKKKCFSMI